MKRQKNWMTVDKMKRIIEEEFTFSSLVKNNGIVILYRKGDLDIGVSYEDHADDGREVYIYNLFCCDEYINIGNTATPESPINEALINELVEEWNKLLKEKTMEYWYKVDIYGSSKSEEIVEIRKRIQAEFPVQENGVFGTEEWCGEWDEDNMKACMIPLSIEYPDVLFVISEDYNDLEEINIFGYYYFSNGIEQHTKQSKHQDSVIGELFPDNLDKTLVPEHLIMNGQITITGDKGLYRIVPIREGNKIILRIYHEQDGVAEETIWAVLSLNDGNKGFRC